MHDLEQQRSNFTSTKLPGKLVYGPVQDHTTALEAAIRHAVDSFIHDPKVIETPDVVYDQAMALLRFLNMVDAPLWAPGYDQSEHPALKGWVHLAIQGTFRITWQRVYIEFEPQVSLGS